MTKATLPKQLEISGNIESFLAQFTDAIRLGYRIVPSFYSPNCTPHGLMMVTMELVD